MSNCRAILGGNAMGITDMRPRRARTAGPKRGWTRWGSNGVESSGSAVSARTRPLELSGPCSPQAFIRCGRRQGLRLTPLPGDGYAWDYAIPCRRGARRHGRSFDVTAARMLLATTDYYPLFVRGLGFLWIALRPSRISWYFCSTFPFDCRTKGPATSLGVLHFADSPICLSIPLFRPCSK